MRTLIIAEAGVNHNGSLETAKKLALTAKKCGADIVKFQTAKLNSMVSKHAYMADYQKKNIGVEMSQRDMLKKLLLTYNEFIELAVYCKQINVCFLSTPFDLESIEFLEKLGCSMWKIPSGEITNYPTPMEDVNLNAMLTLKEKYGCAVGYSDHTKGIEVPIAAVALGAEVIEKHFTLDCRMEGPDHKASLEPDELEAMIRAIRNIEKALGDGIKIPSESEKANIAVARKSIIAADNIKVGDILTKENLTTKRPGTGISPMRWNEILGTRAIRNFEEDELIEI